MFSFSWSDYSASRSLDINNNILSSFPLILSLFPEKAFYIIPEKREVTVGKSNSDLIITNDSSISRKHCVLHIALKDACPKTSTPIRTRTGVWVVDSGSKYGTFLLNEKDRDTFNQIPHNEPIVLQHGSMLRFGILQNLWR